MFGIPSFAPRRVLNQEHSLNQGRMAWWMVQGHQFGGPTWFDLVRNVPGTLTSYNAAYGWNYFSNPGGRCSFLGDGTHGYVNIGTGWYTDTLLRGVSAHLWCNALSYPSGSNITESLRLLGSLFVSYQGSDSDLCWRPWSKRLYSLCQRACRLLVLSHRISNTDGFSCLY